MASATRCRAGAGDHPTTEADRYTSRVTHAAPDAEPHLDDLPGGSDLAEIDRLRLEVATLQEEVLRLRDAVVGKDAERAAALGRAAELEAWALRYDAVIEHHEAVLGSTSWRTTQRLLTPLRWVRGVRPR